jgi:hypothetical protein
MGTAAFDAVAGLIIEASFVATFVHRFFSRRGSGLAISPADARAGVGPAFAAGMPLACRLHALRAIRHEYAVHWRDVVSADVLLALHVLAGPIVYRGLLTWIVTGALAVFGVVYFVARRRRN